MVDRCAMLLDIGDDAICLILRRVDPYIGLARVMRTCTELRVLAVQTELWWISGQLGGGDAFSRRVEHDMQGGIPLFATGGTPTAQTTAIMQHDISMRMPGYHDNMSGEPFDVAPIPGSRVRWRQFVFGHRVAPQSDVVPDDRCFRAIHEFNHWMRAATRFVGNMFDDDCGWTSSPPPSDFINRLCADYAIVALKRCLLQNKIFSRLIDRHLWHDSQAADKTLLPKELETEREWIQTGGPYSDYVEFVEDFGSLKVATEVESLIMQRHQLVSRVMALSAVPADSFEAEILSSFPQTASITSWILWAVYGSDHGGLVDVWLQVLIGRATLDTLVPGRLHVSDSDVQFDPNRSHRPLRQWLAEHRTWLSDPIVELFYEAAGEIYAAGPRSPDDDSASDISLAYSSEDSNASESDDESEDEDA